MKGLKDKKGRVIIGQVLCLCLVVVGVIGLGGEIFLNNLHNMTTVYIFAAMGIVGFLGNAALAVYRVYIEWEK